MDKEKLKKIIIENAKNRKPQPIMPSALQMAKNLAKTTFDTVKSVSQGNPMNISDEQAASRKAICNDCSFFNKMQERCSKCGCYMKVKTYLKAAVCPVGKW